MGAQKTKSVNAGEIRHARRIYLNLNSFNFPALNARSPSLSGWASCRIIAGDHLISHTVARAVPSAQRGLTSVFGMGTGDPSQYGHRQAWQAFAGRLSRGRDPFMFFLEGSAV